MKYRFLYTVGVGEVLCEKVTFGWCPGKKVSNISDPVIVLLFSTHGLGMFVSANASRPMQDVCCSCLSRPRYVYVYDHLCGEESQVRVMEALGKQTPAPSSLHLPRPEWAQVQCSIVTNSFSSFLQSKNHSNEGTMFFLSENRMSRR